MVIVINSLKLHRNITMKNENTGWNVITLNDENIWEIDRTGLKHDEAVSYAAYNNMNGKPSKTHGPDEGFSLKISKMIKHNIAAKELQEEIDAIEGKIESLQYLKKELIFDRDS